MITVVGSINMDLVTVTKQIPKQGETLLGTSFSTIPGGKGANQAVAAARLGGHVHMIGRVGEDEFGHSYLKHLQKNGVHIANVKPVTHLPTGIASITVCDGENSIIVVPGANAELTPSQLELHKEIILNSDIVLLQLEIPMETVEKTLRIAKEGNTKVILNPAPFQIIPDHWWEFIDYMTPNEFEAAELLKHTKDPKSILEKLIITKGSKGVSYFSGEKETSIPSYKVHAVDTTGAGDTFNGAFAVALQAGKNKEEACQFAVGASAMSVTKFGAQSGMPTVTELESWLESQGE